ncbi:MAG: hypothetical protein KatS3mg102_1815 [Planctomycetota bacterium]|nr:MAG: hypothetical protein KatS3mg102_1815 [Planctomycetota bacterium]
MFGGVVRPGQVLGAALLALALAGCENRPERALTGCILHQGGVCDPGASTTPAFAAVGAHAHLLLGSANAPGEVWMLAQQLSGHLNHVIQESAAPGFPFVALAGSDEERLALSGSSSRAGIVLAAPPDRGRPRTSYRVLALEGTRGVFVHSNPVAAKLDLLASPGTIDVVAPATGASPAAAPVIAGPAQIDWTAGPPAVQSYLVLVREQSGIVHTLVQQTGTSLVLGSPGALPIVEGSPPLPSGTWSIVVVGLDADDWGIATSADPTSGPRHWFRVP